LHYNNTMKNKKKLYIGLGVVLALLLIVAISSGGNENDAAKVMAEKAQLVTITETVAANGKIQPAIDVKISSDVSGEIIELAVQEGDKVDEGQLLVKINPDIYVSALNRAEAALNSGKANLANARARLIQIEAVFANSEKNYARNVSLFEGGAISQSEFDLIEANFKGSRADVEASKQNVESSRYSVQSAAASVKEATDNLKRTTIYAPETGIVSALSVEQGERVVGTAQMAGTEMMRIANLLVMEVHVDVNETDIIRVSKGDTTVIEVDAYLGKEFKGVVTEIANAATSSGMNVDQVTNFAVKIRMISDSYKTLAEDMKIKGSPFRPGMSATVEIQTETANNVIAVPIEAVTTREDTSSKKMNMKDRMAAKSDDTKKTEPFECVFVVKDGKAELRVVKTDIQDTKFIRILEGVEEGEEIITGPYALVSRSLTNGQAIEVTDAKLIFGRKD
jgi:HlyD family secretion protein